MEYYTIRMFSNNYTITGYQLVHVTDKTEKVLHGVYQTYYNQHDPRIGNIDIELSFEEAVDTYIPLAGDFIRQWEYDRFHKSSLY